MDKSSLLSDAAPAPTAFAPPRDEPHIRSRGEKLFDWITYGGLAATATFLLTVPLTFFLKYGRGRSIHESCAKSIQSLLDKPRVTSVINGIFEAGDNARRAEDLTMTTNLMMGGNLMMIPVGIMEKFKIPIAETFNRWLGDRTPKEKIQETPKQTAWSIVKARGVAWLTVFSSFKLAGKFYGNTLKTFETETGNLLCRVLGKPASHSVGGEIRPTKTFRYGEIGALDIFATIAATVLLYIGGHFFARKQEERKERKLERQHARGLPFADAVANDNIGIAANKNIPATTVAHGKTHDGALDGAVRAQVM